MADACYVHVPFCRSICYYCAFCRWIYDENRIDPWLDQIQKEVHSKSISHLKTLYFGGGTPNSLSESSFIKLASFFKPYLDNNYEWTVECNPCLLYTSGFSRTNDQESRDKGRSQQTRDLFHQVGSYNTRSH